MDYSFSRHAVKEFLKFDKKLQVRILSKLEFFLSQDNPLEFAKSIIGATNTYRFRIGDYRLIFELLDEEILILKIDSRGSVYK